MKILAIPDYHTACTHCKGQCCPHLASVEDEIRRNLREFAEEVYSDCCDDENCKGNSDLILKALVFVL